MKGEQTKSSGLKEINGSTKLTTSGLGIDMSERAGLKIVRTVLRPVHFDVSE